MRQGIVRDYYDSLGIKEWRRLEKSAYSHLEWLTHIHFIDKFLPKGGRVLDAGGGPGRYSIYLAKKGFSMTLLDFSPVQLRIARQKVARARILPSAIECIEGDIRDMSSFPDNHFDAVLCLTALSHLIDRKDRDITIRNLVRVAKRGAPLFISVINRYAVFRTILKRRDLWPSLLDLGHQDVFDKGVHRAHPGKRIGHFTDAYFFTPSELRRTFEEVGVEVLTMAASQGLTALLGEEFNGLVKDVRMRRKWMEIHWQTCEDTSLIGISEHVLLVGRKS